MKKVLIFFCVLALTLAVGISMSFAAKPITYYTLTVASTNPTSGVAITVSPLDRNGAGNGTTQFTRSYANGAVVTLTAPATSTGGSFLKWQKGTADYATTPTTTVTMSANTTMTAVYGTPPACTRIAPTVTFNPTSQNVAKGASVMYAVTVTNKDTAGCTNSTFVLSIPSETGTTANFVLPSTLSATSPNPCALAPNGTCTTTLTVRAQTAAVAGSTNVTTVRATDATNHSTLLGNGTVTTTVIATPTAEACQDGIDNDLDGRIDCADTDCTADFSCVNVNHKGINSYNGPATCIACHTAAGTQVLNSMHGSWIGPTPNVPNIVGDSGKWRQTNNYCTDPQMADFGCLKCHVSLVAPLTAGKVDMSKTKLTAADMDCLQCHQAKYFATFMPVESTRTNYTSCVDGTTHSYVVPLPEADGKIHKSPRLDLAPGETLLSLVRTVTRPNNATCVTKCHAAAGGGDGVKRGDIDSKMVDPTTAIDVHLSSAGVAKLTCTSCHAGTSHQIPGRGNDMRGEDVGAVKKCVDCHVGMDSGTGHANLGNRTEPDRHVARVDCTGCHIDAYAKGIATEMSRDWTKPVWSASGCEGQGAYVGTTVKGSNVVPEYRFWNKTSWVYDRNGTTGLTTDLIDGGLAMSYPLGDINNGKLYPFKVHTSNNPIDSTSGKTNFDVMKQFMTGCFDQAAVSGLAYIGESGAYTWTNNKAFQLITHGVAPAITAENCTKCHGDMRANLNLTTISKMDKLGYKLKDVSTKICGQCHAPKTPRTHESMHGHLNKGSGIDCLFCHTFTRPERNLCSPCNPACVSEFVDTTPYPHVCN